jgi:hypothetical protein
VAAVKGFADAYYKGEKGIAKCHVTNIGTQRVGFQVGSDSLRRLARARHM